MFRFFSINQHFLIILKRCIWLMKIINFLKECDFFSKSFFSDKYKYIFKFFKWVRLLYCFNSFEVVYSTQLFKASQKLKIAVQENNLPTVISLYRAIKTSLYFREGCHGFRNENWMGKSSSYSSSTHLYSPVTVASY